MKAKIALYWSRIKKNWRDILARTAKTFVATALGVFSLGNIVAAVSGLTTIDSIEDALLALAASAISAAITAAWNAGLSAVKTGDTTDEQGAA